MSMINDDDDDDAPPPLTEADIAALELALKLVREESPGRAEQLALKLADDGWWPTARFAAYSRQVDALHLKPWEHPPCWATPDDDYPDREAARLLKRMLSAGISQFDPDPMVALEAAKAAKKVRAG
jgi:hypothetical protein